MKTKDIFLPAIALLAGTLLTTTAFAQELDYHELETIKKEVTNTVKNSVPQKTYLNVGELFNQMNEDLPINYNGLLVSALNSVRENKISDKDQYELMAFAIQTNHNKVLETLLKAGFKANIDAKLNEAGTKVTPLTETAQAFQNKVALDLLNEYMPKLKMVKKLDTKKVKQKPHGEYMYKIYRKPAATATIKVVP